jgi:hypothetical protein
MASPDEEAAWAGSEEGQAAIKAAWRKAGELRITIDDLPDGGAMVADVGAVIWAAHRAAEAVRAGRKHTYMVQLRWVRVNDPIAFPDGERVVAVLESGPVNREGVAADMYITVLVELPEEASGDK